MWWRRGRKQPWIVACAKRNRCACSDDSNRRICHFRRRVVRCEFPDTIEDIDCIIRGLLSAGRALPTTPLRPSRPTAGSAVQLRSRPGCLYLGWHRRQTPVANAGKALGDIAKVPYSQSYGTRASRSEIATEGIRADALRSPLLLNLAGSHSRFATLMSAAHHHNPQCCRFPCAVSRYC
jgi:hypothetical protein